MRRHWGWIVLAGLAVAGSVGCQTWTSGMTLPSPDYMDHSPQYIPEGPSFPLSRELGRMQTAQPVGTGFGPQALPPQVPPGGFR